MPQSSDNISPIFSPGKIGKYLKDYSKYFPILFLTLALATAVYYVRQVQKYRSEAQEQNNQQNKEPQEKKPEFKKGELLVKFQDNVKDIKTRPDKLSTAGDVAKTAVTFSDVDTSTVPFSLHAVTQKAKIEKIEKLFKNIGDPNQEVANARNRFRNEIANNTRHIDEEQLS